MKQLITIGLLLIMPIISFAQNALDQDLVNEYQKRVGDHAALFFAPIEDPISMAKWINHPYWDTDELGVGEVCYDGVVYQNVAMRFNVAQQQLAVATPVTRALVTPDMSKVSYFTLFDKKFIPHNDKFICLEFSTPGLEFWHEKTKVRGHDIYKNNRSYNSYDESNKYFLIKDGVTIQVKKAKDIAKQFPKIRKQVMKYLYNSDIMYSKSKEETMLATLMFISNIE